MPSTIQQKSKRVGNWTGEQVSAWENRTAHPGGLLPCCLYVLLPRCLVVFMSCCLSILLSGCAHIPNQFREDGPSVSAEWDSPTAADVKSRTAAAESNCRDWELATVSVESGAVTHWPLYFEDPFVDKGHGRTDETHPFDVHRLGWEDYLALPYCLARHTANWLLLPASAVVTPPWTLMESDGRLSRQLLGYDHDATRASEATSEGPAEPVPPESERDSGSAEPEIVGVLG